jgi:hypothetical protein
MNIMNMKSRLALKKIAMGRVLLSFGMERRVRNDLSPPNEPDGQDAAKENSSTDESP